MKTLFLALSLVVGIVPALDAHAGSGVALQRATESGELVPVTRVQPLESLVVLAAGELHVTARDGAGRTYLDQTGRNRVSFEAGGALGEHHVHVADGAGATLQDFAFQLEAETNVDDGGKYRDMFRLFRQSLNTDSPTGVSSVTWNGKTYRYFVSWMLDDYHTMKGMKYFSPIGAEFIDLMRTAQREDGMIWSNINLNHAVAYYLTEYGPLGYIRKYGDQYFVRQPTENHPEYNYVSAIYSSWKASGDDAWMQPALDSAKRALDYCVTDRARWSQRFQLLKRVYTIDSWDFSVDDAYTPHIGLSRTMVIDPDKSKFGVFFGDNVYYAAACDELAEMFAHVGRDADAAAFRRRAGEIRSRLDALSWNGRFFTHFIDEDPTVKRDLGVDEKSQIAQGNAYALNRGVTQEQAVAILKTYHDLQAHLPPGSPGEWYSIYPPFQKGFTTHDDVWQYMNGGVGGHVAGELARGAFTHGWESYGRDILDRLYALGKKYDNKIYFSYTGAIPPPPPAPSYQPLDLSRVANMDLTDQGSADAAKWMGAPRAGDDIRGLPTGTQTFAGIRFLVTDPAVNGRRSAVAVSHANGLPASVEIPVGASAASIYVLHTASKPESENICGSVVIRFEDGSEQTQYIVFGKQLTYWWFPELSTPTSGVAWHGPSPVAADVGLSWCALPITTPEKKIRSILLHAPEGKGIYVVNAITLADRPHYVPPSPISFGGPDNWAAATAMAALVEGLVGVDNSPETQAFIRPQISPRWDATERQEIRATVRCPAGPGYVSYRYESRPAIHQVTANVTGSGQVLALRFLLPRGARARQVTVDGRAESFRTTSIAESTYVEFEADNARPHRVAIDY